MRNFRNICEYRCRTPSAVTSITPTTTGKSTTCFCLLNLNCAPSLVTIGFHTILSNAPLNKQFFLNGYRTHSNGVSFTLSVTTARLNWKLIYPNESLYFDAAQARVLIIRNNSHSAGGHNEIVGHLE